MDKRGIKPMTFEEALQALQRAQNVTWSASFEYNDLSIFDGLTQAIEMFKRMNDDLNQCKVDLKLLEMLSKSLG